MKKYQTLRGSTHYSDEFQFQCSEAEHDPDYRGWHDHDFNEIALIRKGKGYHKTLWGKRRIKKGSLIFVDPNEPHGYAVEDTLSVVNFIFSAKFLKNLNAYLDGGNNERVLSGLFRENKRKPLQLKPDEIIYCEQVVSKILNELDVKAPLFTASVRSLFSELVVALCRSSRETALLSEKTRETESEIRIEKAIQYIERNYSEKLTLEEIAACSSYSPAYMSNFFKKNTGYALFEYINEVRIQKACELLKQSDATVLEVAYDVGFNSISLFNRTFKKLIGLTPRQFRKIPDQ